MTFAVGQRVTTPKGAGTVLYQRLNPLTGLDAAAVAVVLDGSHDRGGVLFLAELVTGEGGD